MNISPLMAEDVEDLLYAADRFSEEAQLEVPVNHQDFLNRMIDMITGNLGNVLIARSDDGDFLGTIGFFVVPVFWNDSYKVGEEMFWWVRPEYRNSQVGMLLLREAEAYMKHLGASEIHMFSLESSNPELAGKIYIKDGFTLLQHTYRKRL